MLFVLVGLVVVFYIARNIYEFKTNKKNKTLKNFEWAFAICAVAVLIVVCAWGNKTNVEEYSIPIHNVQDFKVKMTEDYCTWDDGYGETYIVSKNLVQVETFPNDEVRKYSIICNYKYSSRNKWVNILLDFGLLKTPPDLLSTTYHIECPERSVIISQKSNRKVKITKIH